jgi:hypothetical protein
VLKALPKNVIVGLHPSRAGELRIRRTSRRLLLSQGPVRASHGMGISVCNKLWTNPDEAIYKSSWVSQEPRVRRGRGVDACRSRSALALMGTLRIKKEVENLYVTHAAAVVRPARTPTTPSAGMWHRFVLYSTSQ